MFYWMKRSGGPGPGTGALGGLGTGALGGLGTVSKAEILRGIVTEKLSTAAQEILAVVERTVSGYEEEAAGFRREIERQKKQLELLLQPRVKLERKAMISDVEEQEEQEEQEEVVLEEEEEEEQHTQHAGVEDTGSLGLLWFDDEEDGGDDDDDGGDEEQQLTVMRREDLKDPDYQMTPRLISPRGRSDRRRPGRPRLSDAPSHLVLRICILEDSRTAVLSNTVFKRNPVQEVTCPRGLQEADFLALLRSSFPQLAGGDKPFDIFTSDRTKTLLPLSVETLTPEEICRSLRRAGRGNSALYIRLKSDGDDLHPQSSRSDDSPSRSVATATDDNETCASLSSPRRRRGRPRLGEEPSHHLLRVCMLDDSQSDVLSNRVLMKSSVKEVTCPRGLQEADFLALLRSSFPQLAGGDKPFDVFKSDRSRRLRRLDVTTLTPAEIFRTRSTGIEKTLLYIRPKTGEEEEEEEEEELFQRNDDVTSERPSDAAVTMQSDAAAAAAAALGSSSSVLQTVDGTGGSAARQQDEETEDESNGDKESSRALEADQDWRPDPEPQTSRPRSGPGSGSGSGSGPGSGSGSGSGSGPGPGPGSGPRLLGGRKTPCKVCGVWYRIQGGLIKHAWVHVDEAAGVCGVCGRHFESAEELKGHLKTYQKTHECSYCRKSFFTVSGLRCHTTLHTGDRPFKCDVCGKTFAHMSNLSIHRWVHVEDKPYKCELCPRAFGLKGQLRAHGKLHSARERYHCSVCGKSLYDRRSLARHKTTHSGERRHACLVCGKRFKLPGTLKSHEKTHTERERPYLCHVCCKTFLSNCGLTAHMRTHSGERPFACAVCGKGFVSNGERKAHTRVHTGEAPYGCSECGRFFKRKTHLTNHVRSHMGIKLFVCSVCGKACSRQEHLTVHMRTHNGERPYQCPRCDRAFTQSHCLKTHMKSHRGEEEGEEEEEEEALLNAPPTS